MCVIERFKLTPKKDWLGSTILYQAWLARTSFEKGCAYSGFSFEIDLVDVLGFSWPRLRSMVLFHWLLMFQTASSLFSLMFHYVCVPSF